MLALLKNEYIKLFKRTKTLVAIGLLVLGAGLLTVMLYTQEQNMLKWQDPAHRIEIEKEQIGYEKEYLQEVEKEISRAKTDAEKLEAESNKENSLNYIKSKEEEIKRLEDVIANPKNWKEQIKNQIKDYKQQAEDIKEEIAAGNLNAKGHLASIQEEIEFLEYHLDNNLEPMENWGFYPGFALIQVSMMLLFLIPLFVAIFGSDIVSDESTNETFKFLLIQPVKRGKILLSKFITLISSALGLLLGVQGIIFLGIGAIRGFSDLNQIVKVGVRYKVDQEILMRDGQRLLEPISGTGEFITYGDLLVRSLGLQVLFILACCTVVFMFSTICKSNMISAAASVIVLVGGAALPSMIYQLGEYSHISFLSYGATASVIQGDIQMMYQNTHLTPVLGAALMVGTIIICYLIAHINFSKKDILV